MSNNREREDFGVTLRLRQGLVLDDTKERTFGIRGSNFQKATVGFSLLINPTSEAIYKDPLFMVSFSSNDSSLNLKDKTGTISQEQLKTEFLQRLIQKLSTGNKPASYRGTTLTVNNMLIAQSADTLGTAPTYRHFDDNDGYYHSENKILETVKTLPQTRGFEDVSLYSDRINCERCQELNFRANRVSPYNIFSSSMLILDPIAGGVAGPFSQKNLLAATHIKRVEMRSGPLQLAETVSERTATSVIPFIDQLIEGNSDLCTAEQ